MICSLIAVAEWWEGQGKLHKCLIAREGSLSAGEECGGAGGRSGLSSRAHPRLSGRDPEHTIQKTASVLLGIQEEGNKLSQTALRNADEVIVLALPGVPISVPGSASLPSRLAGFEPVTLGSSSFTLL